jgi:predicted kinase
VATYVLSGPPCSGKSTLARHLAQPDDAVLDFDRICQELGSGARHEHPREIRDQAEQEMQRRMWRLRFHRADAYVIRWAPRPHHRVAYAKRLDATVWLLNPGHDECVRRARLDDRPDHTVDAIRKWYRLYRPASVDTACPYVDGVSPQPTVTSREW